jgi:uncharacterized protein YcbK (DUF882 family)
MKYSIERRDFLRLGMLASAASLFPGSALAAVRHWLPSERSLSFYNIHTREGLEIAYWGQGAYVPTALSEINHILRDHRTDEIRPIDPHLLDLLYAIQKTLAANSPFHILSGYRSPATNSYLRRRGRGVAKNSLHMQGKAADVRLPGCDLPVLRRAALDLKGGGVGYYPRADFVHLDVGPLRFW